MLLHFAGINRSRAPSEVAGLDVQVELDYRTGVSREFGRENAGLAEKDESKK